MKKINVFFAILLMAVSTVLLPSCGKDDAKTPPSIKVTAKSGVTVKKGEKATFDVEVSSATSDLKDLKVTADPIYQGAVLAFTNSGTTTADALKSDGTFKSGLHAATFTFEYTVPTNATKDQEITLTFVINDKDAGTNNATQKFKVADVVTTVTLTAWSASATVGDQSVAEGSSCVGLDGTVYKGADVTNNTGKIDFVMYTTASVLYLYAPSAAAPLYTAVNSWTTKNATKFYTTTVTSANYLTATSAELSTAIASSQTSYDKMAITADKVFAFVTVGGVKGFIHVKSVTATNAVLEARITTATTVK